MSIVSGNPSNTSFDGSPSTDSDSSDDPARRKPRTNAATGASAAGVRALSAQAVAFYFRAPAKAFFRTRVDYMALAKAINPRVAEGSWSWHTTTPGLLAHAVRMYGWRFLPDQVLPPLVGNIVVGAVLYTSYLQILSGLHEPTLQATKRIYPPPAPSLTFTAGFAAGGIQSIIAAPLDALQVRFSTSDMIKGQYRNVWQYGKHKLHEIGIRGIFSGWGLSFLKDSFGSALFFGMFETIKSQGYYTFVRYYYGSLKPHRVEKLSVSAAPTSSGGIPSIQPHYALEPCFLMLAGVTASLVQQFAQHPLNLVQTVYYERLEHIDAMAKLDHSGMKMMKHHYEAYLGLFGRCQKLAIRAGGWHSWLFRGFFGNAVRLVPSTSAGLIIFELVRRKYGVDAEIVHIQQDGYEIILT
ncbi:mitochondrial carrier protein [Histoplasma capsulatum G186AR]|uniref:Mitochondrial carrier protein n=1 Tax=Ajellomyces capsulatus TaxID=5037 RepID=A0A8H7YJL1_AJECA|nr:mitochondrial carrier protein [Histoplasma capsulatum]QSS75040.1 mitochondrial carrier protein [Histoplasma capsulatum G186AR]